ncbi:7036_t:CDS:10 [Scutellospora calospora]|uniref:7036_t:CDS:1 n=1 Tax=Scutellospora calospora TaxID=85575 RepID=A0ACA9KDX2_9GLOM|nr:7036_t:CDS:10 [Scutellospora calospora]
MQSLTKTESSVRPTHSANVLKEKFVEIYENFFKGNDPSIGNPHFWSELFLLKVNSTYLTKCISEITQDKLLAIKACIGNINKIFLKSIEMMNDELTRRKINAVEQLVDAIKHLMEDDQPEIRYEVLRLAIMVVCGNSNINQNSINEFFMKNALSYVGAIIPWGTSGSTKEQPDISDIEQAFSQLPSVNIAILLVYYDFVNNNKEFIAYISKALAEYNINSDNDGLNFLDFLSFASYLVQHNRLTRTASYAKLSFLLLIILTEDVTFDSCISDKHSFFPDSGTYDNLVYEIVRSYEVFEGLSKIINIPNPVKSSSQKFSSSDHAFVNINTICQHFHLKIEAWKVTNRVQTLLPEQFAYIEFIYENITAIINANYDSLNLITPEKLDNYASYSEIPYNVPFARQVLRLVVEDFKRREVLLD